MQIPPIGDAMPEELWRCADDLKSNQRGPEDVVGIKAGQLIELLQELGIARKKLQKIRSMMA